MMISETLYDFINVSNRYKIMFNHIKVLSQAFKWSTWSDKSSRTTSSVLLSLIESLLFIIQ